MKESSCLVKIKKFFNPTKTKEEIQKEFVEFFDLQELSTIPSLSILINNVEKFTGSGIISLVRDDVEFELLRGEVTFENNENAFFVSKIKRKIDGKFDDNFECLEIKTDDKLFDGKIWGLCDDKKQYFVKENVDGKPILAHIKFDGQNRMINYFNQNGTLIEKENAKNL